MVELKSKVPIGDWILDKELGTGGQGVVWKVRYARDKHSPPGALKICTQDGEKARARFSREIELLRKLNHPGIVQVRHASQHEGTPYYVMEFATTSLERVVTADTAGPRLVRDSGALLLNFVRQACAGLAHLHEAGILHRDVKPSNVLLMLDPPDPMKAVIADLGIAAHDAEQRKLTATHEVIGSQGFRAPESLAGIHTAASDVYAFGKTLEFVFSRGLAASVGPGQCSRSPLFSNDLWDRLDEILRNACAFDPAARYKNAQTLLEAIPEVVVTVSGSPSRKDLQSEISLSDAEAVTLSELLSQCTTVDDWTRVDAVKDRVDLVGYQFTLALRRLQELGLAETRMTSSYNSFSNEDQEYAVCQPTPSGVRWAQSNGAVLGDSLRFHEATRKPTNGSQDEFPF